MLVGIGILIMVIVWLVYSGSQSEPVLQVVEKECLSGYVTIEGDYGQRLVLGDMEICGIDLEVGSITGPSKLYDPGDPL